MADLRIRTDTTAKLFFYLVDATDGITAETGITTGSTGFSLQVSKDGSAWTTTGVGAWTEIGNGHYYVPVDISSAGLNCTVGQRVVGRVKADATAEAPSLNQIHVVEFNPNTDIGNLVDRLGAFAGSGSNTVLGFLRAMARKDAALPTDMNDGVGTYAVATDSLEATAEQLVSAEGAAFATSSDSLHAIRAAIDTLIAPAITTATSVGSGFLGDVIDRIRKYASEPSLDAAYSNTDLIRMIQDAWTEVYRETCMVADWQQWVRYTLTIAAATTEYALPPNFDQILKLEKMDESGEGVVLWEFNPRHPLSPYGPGWSIEGTTLRLEPKWSNAETLRLSYRPTGQVSVHEADATVWTSTTITFPSTVSVGSLDKRVNAYAGYIIRPITGTLPSGSFYQQERTITSYDPNTRIATFSPAWSPLYNGATLTYEVLPQSADAFRKVIALKVARLLAVSRANNERATMLNTEYQDAKRLLQAHFANMNQRIGKSFARGVRRPWASGRM